MSKLRWGDAVEDEDVLPDNFTTGPNDKGVLTKTEYYHNSKGEATKKTTKIQLVKVQTRVYEISAERKHWAKYGHAAKSNEGVTMQSVDEIMFERNNNKKAEAEKKPENAMSEMSLTEMLAEKRRNRELMRAQGLLDPIEELPKEGGDAVPSASKEGKYVPPTRKAGAAGATPYGDRRDTDPSLRVSNLSENVSDHDLKNLFGNFGDITRVYVAKDRDTNEHRGFAFVNFRHKNQAEDAMRALNGYGYDNMILRVEMAAPREQRP